MSYFDDYIKPGEDTWARYSTRHQLTKLQKENTKVEERYKMALEIIASMSQQEPSAGLLGVAVNIANIALGSTLLADIKKIRVDTT